MTFGCLVGLLAYAALAAAYYVFFTPRFEWPGNALAAGLGSLFAAMFLSSLYGVFRATRQARQLGQAATTTVGTLQDGEMVAIAGTIRPLGPPLASPVSGTPCVAYDYDVYRYARRETVSGGRTVSETYEDYFCSGLALTPSIIDTPTGGVRLLSFAMLDAFPRETTKTPESIARLNAYIASTSFKPMGVTKVFSAFHALSEALTDQDGAVRMDWRMTEGDIPVEQALTRERIVRVGEQVSAVGKFSRARGGLIADGMASVIQLRPGDAKRAQRDVLRSAWSTFGTSVAMFAASHAILGAMLYMSETRYRRVSPSAQESALRLAVQHRNPDEIRQVIRRGVSPNVRGSHNDTLLHNLNDPELVRVLIQAGADPNLADDSGYTPLMLAAHNGETAVVSVLLDAGANPNIARDDGATALSEALEANQAEAATLLRAHGATSDLVTAENGEPLPAGGGEPMATVRAYLAGVHARDVKAMTAAFIPRRPGFFDGTDFDLWHKIRPRSPEFASGYTNGHAATVTVAGATINNWPLTWHYQLVYRQQLWRIAREWETEPPTHAPSGPAAGGAEPVERPHGR